MKNLQDAFNHMVEHLLTQNQQSTNEETCLYRNGNLKCAVGALIADEHYRPSMENYCADTTVIMSAVEDSGWPCNRQAGTMYMDVQGVHDCYAPQHWPRRLEVIAKLHRLEVPACLATALRG